MDFYSKKMLSLKSIDSPIIKNLGAIHALTSGSSATAPLFLIDNNIRITTRSTNNVTNTIGCFTETSDYLYYFVNTDTVVKTGVKDFELLGDGIAYTNSAWTYSVQSWDGYVYIDTDNNLHLCTASISNASATSTTIYPSASAWQHYQFDGDYKRILAKKVTANTSPSTTFKLYILDNSNKIWETQEMTRISRRSNRATSCTRPTSLTLTEVASLPYTNLSDIVLDTTNLLSSFSYYRISERTDYITDIIHYTSNYPLK